MSSFATPGSPAAAEATQFVAAPLLAGAAVATIGVVGADGPQFRWPGPSMLVLTVAAVFLLNAIQLGLHARHYLYAEDDIDTWAGASERDLFGPVMPPSPDARAARARQQQRADFYQWRLYTHYSEQSYEAGLGMLLVAMAGLAAPPSHASLEHAVCRWCAVGVVMISLASHLGFTVRRARSSTRQSGL